MKCSSRGTQTREALLGFKLWPYHLQGLLLCLVQLLGFRTEQASGAWYAKVIEILSNPFEKDLLLRFIPFVTLSFDVIHEICCNPLRLLFPK